MQNGNIPHGKAHGINHTLPGREVEVDSHSPSSVIETFDLGVQSVARAKASHGFTTPNQQRILHGLGSPGEHARGVPDHIAERQVKGRLAAQAERNERHFPENPGHKNRSRPNERQPDNRGRDRALGREVRDLETGMNRLFGTPVRTTSRPTRRVF